ncbi:MAG: transcriptional repressor [Actinobacteria bacterium]|nr:transcriptional repressor [Actinomycetota bacterium]
MKPGSKNGNISDVLIKKNIKPSYQRIKVFEYLLGTDSHPTVEQIYSDLVNEIPTLSKATIYNTLNLFEGAQLARVITIEENETRYDACIEEHGHFKCENCGKIYDFPVNLDNLVSGNGILENFKVNEKNIYFKGICSKCLNNKSNKQEGKNGTGK